MSLIATAKAKAARGSVKAAFSNEQGAIDLASIMVGIIVIGLIGGVIAATVFAVIPWAQDNAAKQQLDSIAAAQSAYVGLSADAVAADGTKQIAFSNGGSAAGGKVITSAQGSLFDGTNADVWIVAEGNGNAAHYAAAVQSASSKIFYITDAKTQPTDTAVTAPAADSLAADAVAGLN